MKHERGVIIMASYDDLAVRSEAAFTVIKKNFGPLSKAITVGEIPTTLYSEDLIEHATFQRYINKSSALVELEIGRLILSDVQNMVSINPDLFELLCKILNREDHAKKLAEILYVGYQSYCDEKREKFQSEVSSGSKAFEELKVELEVFKRMSGRSDPPEGVDKLVEKAISHYIETSLDSDVGVEVLKRQMLLLCNDELLISADVYKWALEEIVNISNQQTASGARSNTLALLPKTPPKCAPPSLPPDTLYHASLCCHAVNSCNKTREVHDYFNQHGHKLQEASLSPQKEIVEQYLIAKNGNTIYVAFKSKSTVKQWISTHDSFEQGLEEQTQRVPLQFFMEQLLKQQKIVFTGFSFGGMLACCVAANLWRAPTSSLNAALLQKNVICITFGQPLIGIPYVQETIEFFPKFEQTIHLVLDKEDVIPGLFHYFRIGCNLHALSLTCSTTKSAASMLADAGKLVTDFKGQFTKKFLTSLETLQTPTTYSKAVGSKAGSRYKAKSSDSLKTLKETLQELVSMGAPMKITPDNFFGKMHLITLVAGKGIRWRGEVSKKIVMEELLQLDKELIERLDVLLFKAHNMVDYRQKTLRSYLDYLPTPPPKSPTADIQQVAILNPTATSVEFHLYRDEHVVVLEGNNLWFCYKVHLGDEKDGIKLESPVNIMRRSIQFKFAPSKKTESVVVDGKVDVTLYSHFSEELSKKVQAKKEPYTFSLRQIQLAKHTPTDLIQLAYCAAMLEHPCEAQTSDQPLTSKRFEKVKAFLEEAAKIVPLESVFYAIAYADKQTALTCGKALQETNVNFPPSITMSNGAHNATKRVKCGLRGEEYRGQEYKTIQHTATLPFPIKVVAGASVNTTEHVQQPVAGKKKRSSSSSTHKAKRATSAQPRKYADIARQPPPRHWNQTTSPPPEMFPVTVTTTTTVPVHIPPLDQKLALFLEKLTREIFAKAQAKGHELPVISKRTIENFCQFSLNREMMTKPTLESPIRALKNARDRLMSFVIESSEPGAVASSKHTINTEMLRIVRDIRDNNLKVCAALLAAFMEQQIRIPMLKSNIDTAKVLSAVHTPVAMGAWAFVSMGYDEIFRTMLSSEGSSLLIEIGDYIEGILTTSASLNEQAKKKLQSDQKYAAKLDFLVRGMRRSRTVTCSTQYISYCLEHQLHKLSTQLPHFDKTVSPKTLVERWDSTFKDDALSLVAKSHRPLIARWLKWALLVYDLRETLASYTCVGIIGLSNSGKSLLVNTLFKIQTQVGTTESKRTVVPFLYNLDGKVDNLDIIDFPGVDDKDSVPELAKLLVGLAQLVVFVLDYKNINSESASEWLRRLAEEDKDIQVLVCLTHADRLYTELEKELKITNKTEIGRRLKGELANATEKLGGPHPSRTVRYFCFHEPEGTELTFDALKEVGIHSPLDVGEWLVQILQDKLDQHDLAEKLSTFLNK